jgi:chaperonin GroEL
VPGGGVTLFYAARILEKLKCDNEDQQAGINIIKRALSAPLRQIVANAGLDGAIVVGKLSESKDTSFGFNAQNTATMNIETVLCYKIEQMICRL